WWAIQSGALAAMVPAIPGVALVLHSGRPCPMDALSSFIPMDRRQALAEGTDLPAQAEGAVLFADLAGYIALGVVLAAADPPHGLFDVLAGLPLARGAAGEHLAAGGEILLDEAAAAALTRIPPPPPGSIPICAGCKPPWRPSAAASCNSSSATRAPTSMPPS